MRLEYYPFFLMIMLTRYFFAFSFFSTLSLFSAILPHQGRILVSGEAFDGNATFRFALVDPSNDTIVWNHSGGTGVPDTDLVVEVKNGFYKCPLGDTSFIGMAELSPQLFSYYSNLKLRVWFNDGVNGLQQLGGDQPLLNVLNRMEKLSENDRKKSLIEFLSSGKSKTFGLSIVDSE